MRTTHNTMTKVAVITGASSGIGEAVAVPADVSRHEDLIKAVDDWEQVVDVNLKGVLYGIAAQP